MIPSNIARIRLQALALLRKVAHAERQVAAPVHGLEPTFEFPGRCFACTGAL